MKKYLLIPVLALIFAAGTTLRAQDQPEELGLPGDNLNLYAVMKLFQESETLEGFEKTLNDENTRINNLDLNDDGQVDYIRVIDNVDGNVHNIILQVTISREETQDVAVFTVWRESNDRVQIQLTGDEELYGRNYIIEPIVDEGDQTPNPGYTGNTSTINGHNVVINRTTPVEIAEWPVIHFIFMPNYIVWHSPWYYSYYPSYWHPWHPFFWHYYYGYQSHYYSYYYGHYRHWNDHRYPEWHKTYYAKRSYSPNVHGRIEHGDYKQTYSHPEQRKEGTALYYRSHPDKNYKSSDRPSGTTVRRNPSGTGATRQLTGTTTTTRRSTSTVTGGHATSPTSTSHSTTTSTVRRTTTAQPVKRQASPATESRSPSTGSARQTAAPRTESRAASTRTSGQTASPKTESRPASAGTERRSTSGSAKTVASPQTKQKASGTRSSGQSRSAAPNNATRGSNNQKKEGTNDKPQGKRGESRNNN